MKRLTSEAHELMRAHVGSGDVAIDATAGNGHDTIELARLVGPTGVVYAFDRQAEALRETQRRCELSGLENVRFVHACHSQVAAHVLIRDAGGITGLVFNLGYLPGGDKTVITQPDTTCAAIRDALEMLAPGALVSVLAYIGHDGGAREAERVEAYLAADPRLEWLRRDEAVGDRPRLFALRRA